MPDKVSNRKMEHIRIIGDDPECDRDKRYFDQIKLSHRALPECSLDDVDTSEIFLGKRLSFPFLISSMTGGRHELTTAINRNLAIAAEKTGVAMAVGSQRVMFTNPNSIESFALRQYAPTTLLFGNLSADQFNCGFGLEHCRRAVEVLNADGLYLHVNPLQEAVQPEGNTNFTGLSAKIGQIARELHVPVMVKEVGGGISPADVRMLLAKNVRIIDVAGAGGTSWSRIEQRRIQDKRIELGYTFQDWGIPTPTALRLLEPYRNEIDLIASGGIRSGVDIAKAVILGARLCGIAKPLLEPAMASSDAVIERIEELKREFTVAMFLLGCSEVQQLRGTTDFILSMGEL